MIFRTHSQIQFDPIDPLGDGLGDAIAAEQHEEEAIHDLYDMIDPRTLEQRWGALLEEVKHEPDWFDFAD